MIEKKPVGWQLCTMSKELQIKKERQFLNPILHGVIRW